MELVEKGTGKLVQVPDEHAQAAFQSGQYGLPKGARFPVDTGKGTGTVEAGEASKALRDGGRVPSPEAFHEAEREEKYGGTSGAIQAGLFGAAKGATEAVTGMPFDPLAISAAGLAGSDTWGGKTDPYGRREPQGDALVREHLGQLEDRHPGASFAGEAGGMAAGLALSGGRSALGGVGHLAEAAVPRAIEGLGGKVARSAARGVGEGAMLGGISAVDEAALGDHDVTAENVVAGIGHGALIGGAASGLLTGALSGAAGARDAGGRFLASLRPQEVETLAERHFGQAAEGGLGEKVQQAYAKASSAVSGKPAEAVDALTRLSPEGAEARRGVFDSAKVHEEASKGIADTAEGMIASGQSVADEARAALRGEFPTKSGVPLADEQFKGVNDALTKQLRAQRDFHAALTEETGSGRSVSPMKAEMYVKGLVNPKADLVHKAVTEYAASTQSLATALKDIHELPPAKIAELDAAHASAKTFGDQIAKAEKSVVLANQYNVLTKGDHGGLASTLGLAAVGGALGGLAGDSKEGASIGAVAGAAFGALAHPERAVRIMATIERLAAKSDGRIASGVKSFMSGGKPSFAHAASDGVLKSARGEARRTVFEKSVKEVQRLDANPQELAERVGKSLGEVGQHAPKLANAMAKLAVTGTKYLAVHAPQGFAPQGNTLIPSRGPMYSDQEMGEWTRRAAVVNDYTTAIDSLRAGHITPEEVDALKQTNPHAYDKIRTEVMTRIASQSSPLPYGKRVALSILFDFAADATLEPDFMAAIQQNYDDRPQSQQPQGAQQQGGSRPKSVDLEQSAMNAETVGQATGRNPK